MLSWQTKAPCGKFGPSGRDVAVIPSVCEQPSAFCPLTIRKGPEGAGLAVEHGEERLLVARSLRRRDQQAGPRTVVHQRDPLDVGDLVPLRLDRVDHLARGAARGLGGVLPGPDVLLVEVERPGRVVDDATLRFRSHAECPHLLRGEPAGAVVAQGELPDGSGDEDHEDRQLALGAVVETDPLAALGVDRRAAGRDGRQLPGGPVDGVQPQAGVGGCHHIGCAGAEFDILPDVDVAPELLGRHDALHQRAVQVVGLERALLVVADHQRLGGVLLVHPDRGVVGGVAGVLRRLGLGISRHLDNGCGDRGLGHIGILVRGTAAGYRQSGGDHERHRCLALACHDCPSLQEPADAHGARELLSQL